MMAAEVASCASATASCATRSGGSGGAVHMVSWGARRGVEGSWRTCCGAVAGARNELRCSVVAAMALDELANCASAIYATVVMAT